MLFNKIIKMNKIVYLFLIAFCTNGISQTNSFPTTGNVGIGTLSPQSPLDVITPVNGFSSFGNVFSPGSFSGIHFGYRETNSYYRKSALIFQRTDGHNQSSNASGKIHFLLRNDGHYSATDLNDAVVTIDSDPNGNRGTVRFGIGNSNPQTLLHLYGSHSTSQFRLTLPSSANGAGNGEVSLQSWVSEPGVSWDAGGIGMNVSNNNGSPSQFGRLNTQLGQSYIRFIPNGGGMEFNTTENSGTSYKGSMYLTNGKLGLGNLNPQVKLHLGNSTLYPNNTYAPNYNADLFSSNGIIVAEGKSISYSNAYEVHGYSKYDVNAYSTEGRMIHYGYYGLSFATRQGLGIILTGDNNNVGIGINNPSEKLSVNGNIKSKKLIVTQSGWADYVFDSSYQLSSLSEVEKFINVNKHLPGIPTEKEVSKNGIDLGENQVSLLKKIEEMTLYLIKLEKEINTLKNEIKNMKHGVN